MKSRIILPILLLAITMGCDEFVNIDPPRTDLVRETLFQDDATADAAVIDIYYTLKNAGFASGDASSVSFIAALSSDELTFYGTSSVSDYEQFNHCAVMNNNPILASLWQSMYATIYKANAVIEGVEASHQLSPEMAKQLSGEAKFIRAFTFFYLVNLWGDVPMTLTTDYRVNNLMGKSARPEIYDQIIIDLTDAEQLLDSAYTYSANKRTRANKGAATALLSRVYLYTGDWNNAEASATKVISNGLYAMETLAATYSTNSKEAILQLWSDQYANDMLTFFVHPAIGPLYGALTETQSGAFTAGDTRSTQWMENVIFNSTSYYQPVKYKYAIPPVDYSTVLRLAEQYLIRAEARAHLGDPTGASDDLNIIRNRAGLDDLTGLTTEELLDAILRERQKEFFTEWGHRWLDLKRTGKADELLTPLKPEWNSDDQFFPIPEIQIINNPSLSAN